MTTWHTRLEQALTARKVTWDQLVHITGLKKPSVYGWKPGATKRSTMMNGDNAAKVCSELRISPVWLFFGEGESGLDDKPMLSVQEPSAGYDRTRALRAGQAEEELLIAAYRSGDDTAKQLLTAQARAILADKEKGVAAG